LISKDGIRSAATDHPMSGSRCSRDFGINDSGSSTGWKSESMIGYVTKQKYSFRHGFSLRLHIPAEST
jgi:hypothetical protein